MCERQSILQRHEGCKGFVCAHASPVPMTLTILNFNECRCGSACEPIFHYFNCQLEDVCAYVLKQFEKICAVHVGTPMVCMCVCVFLHMCVCARARMCVTCCASEAGRCCSKVTVSPFCQWHTSALAYAVQAVCHSLQMTGR